MIKANILSFEKSYLIFWRWWRLGNLQDLEAVGLRARLTDLRVFGREGEAMAWTFIGNFCDNKEVFLELSEIS